MYKVICDEFLEDIRVNSSVPGRFGVAFVNGRFVLGRDGFTINYNYSEALGNIRIIFMSILT